MSAFVIPRANATPETIRWVLKYDGDLRQNGNSFFLYIDDTDVLCEPLKSAIEQIDQGEDQVIVYYNPQKPRGYFIIKPYYT